MTVPPLGPPPRFLGMKITSNRIEAVLVMFVTLCMSGITYGNDLILTTKILFAIGLIWSVYLWAIKKPERPY
tara:strand:+ start:1354 stop:1569 length:216 start_codon:yes stop_codon:yes gene_type:complete